VAVVLSGFWWLWVRDFLDESGADARRLVERFATVWTAITGDFELLIWIRSGSPLGSMTGITPRCSAICPWFFVLVVVLVGRGRRLFIG